MNCRIKYISYPIFFKIRQIIILDTCCIQYSYRIRASCEELLIHQYAFVVLKRFNIQYA